MTSPEYPSGSSVYLYQRVWYWVRQRLPMGSNGVGRLPAGSIISIEILAGDEVADHLKLRAKVDDVLDVNLIKREKANDTGYAISPYNREGLKDGEGNEYKVTGVIDLQWLNCDHPAKTYPGKFYIAQIPQMDCDVLLGKYSMQLIHGQLVRVLQEKVQTGREKENQAAREKQNAADRLNDIQLQEAKEQERYEEQERQIHEGDAREDDDSSTGDKKGKNPVR